MDARQAVREAALLLADLSRRGNHPRRPRRPRHPRHPRRWRRRGARWRDRRFHGHFAVGVVLLLARPLGHHDRRLLGLPPPLGHAGGEDRLGAPPAPSPPPPRLSARGAVSTFLTPPRIPSLIPPAMPTTLSKLLAARILAPC